MTEFTPTRAAALARLQDFLPRAGREYATRRNFDLPDHPHVSQLSPYLRHRVLTEAEVLSAVLDRHSASAAEKFIQEVVWRTYWKGWLEMRPAVWRHYKTDRQAAWNRVQTESGLRQAWETACAGDTGIDAFDHWARQLTTTGYLHNHARMWFASIWIFTLNLPWALGADFFLRHLLDGDPASNTLSWRWVAGLQTKGKTYLARPDNIAKYTENRFDPTGLADVAEPLSGPDHPRPSDPPLGDPLSFSARAGLLLTEEDLSPQWLYSAGLTPVATATFTATDQRSHLQTAPQVIDFVSNLVADATADLPDVTACTETDAIIAWAKAAELDQIVLPYVPVGPTADALSGLAAACDGAGMTLTVPLRDYDATAWPHATKGFFKFKDAIPDILASVQNDLFAT